MAPILTYTADEIVENAPAIIKGDAEDIFDFTYESIEAVESNFNADYMYSAREEFYEKVDVLKKEKIIKNTLELVLYTESQDVLKMDKTEAEDWFVISGIIEGDTSEELGSFKVDEDVFIIAKAKDAKCPRCWKYQSKDEESTCKRCSEVLSA